MSKKIEIEVEIVPTQGKTEKKAVKVSANGASLGDVLKAGKISADNKDLYVNGSPATLATHVGSNDALRVTERPQGS